MPLASTDASDQAGRHPLTTRLALTVVACSTLSIVSLPPWLPSWLPVPLMCSTARHVLHPMPGASITELLNALLSPFVIPLQPFSARLALLGIINLLWIGVIEQAVGTRALCYVMAAWWPAYLGCRLLWAFVFTRALGWVIFSLFFSASSHECASGLGPLVVASALFAHLVNKSTRSMAIVAALNLLLWSPSSTWQNVSSLSAIVIIAIATLLLSKLSLDRRAAFKRFAIALAIAFAAVVFGSLVANHAIDKWKLATAPLPNFPVTLLIITGPRPGDTRPLETTLESHIPALTELGTSLPGAVHVRVVVHTSFANDTLFDELKARNWPSFVHFIRTQAGSDALQPHLHLKAALASVVKRFPDSQYIYLNEDDYPLCPPHTKHWKSLLQNMVEVDRRQACGYAFGSAESGFVFRSDLLPDLIQTIDELPNEPTDLILRGCLLGRRGCQQRCTRSLPPEPARGSRYGFAGIIVSHRVRLHHIANDFSVFGAGRAFEGVRTQSLQAMETCDARMSWVLSQTVLRTGANHQQHDLEDMLVLPM